MNATNLRSMLIRDEGWVHEAYPDPLTGCDPWTCGVGSTGPDVHQGTVWTDAEIEAHLSADIDEATQGVESRLPWTGRLDDARLGALVNMAFQLGVHGLLGFPHMLAALKAGQWQEAYDQALNSKWATQTPARAQRVATQLKTGVWQ